MRRLPPLAAIVAVAIAVPTIAFASTGNPFVDVPDGAYYDEPVTWAFENDITTGTSDTTFSPGAPVTRGQVVTFLHRYHTNLVTQEALGATADALGCASDEVIHDDGGDWTCARVDLVDGLGPFTTTALTTGGAGGGLDMVLAGTGNPMIVHLDQDALDLVVQSCNDELCTSANSFAVDTDDEVGFDASIMLSGTRPRIAYRDESFGGLALMLCDDTRCSAGTAFPIDGGFGDSVGWDSEITLNGSGAPIIAHRNDDTFELHVCLTSSCFVSTSHKPGIGSVNHDVALVTPSGGRPLLVYSAAAGGLRAYRCDDPNCSSAVDTELVAAVDAVGIDAIVDDAGRAVIAYAAGNELRLYRCSNAACSSGTDLTLPVAAATEHVAIGLGADRQPHVVAIDGAGAARLHVCDDDACTTGETRWIAGSATDIGVAVHDDGSVVVAYVDGAGDVIVAAAEYGLHTAIG